MFELILIIEVIFLNLIPVKIPVVIIIVGNIFMSDEMNLTCLEMGSIHIILAPLVVAAIERINMGLLIELNSFN